ncbi:hypothetical protein IMG5_095370 [Ichthyophthirius multifiliis]|uniref:Uncharacterized protein n=1 Tax=Ichthyophthirius multifiliis TaxID=5932 RepID=G0QRN3_ICHMU|nr:hypothetical protein IMG5_095370 [Ichthyophthirius multifiliis]EGR32122.1 hypothetical protein IMG5_095370 [Ichthyophthirius multifiliis]|eukprot:XP_004035608.1 hypothetical protein IMG5_095370 [Ichthyophthirius multifiliis]
MQSLKRKYQTNNTQTNLQIQKKQKPNNYLEKKNQKNHIQKDNNEQNTYKNTQNNSEKNTEKNLKKSLKQQKIPQNDILSLQLQNNQQIIENKKQKADKKQEPKEIIYKDFNQFGVKKNQFQKKKKKKLKLHEKLLQACQRLNYITPTPIQQKSLPHTLKKKDIIALAETGSGKTLSFALPILQQFLNQPHEYYALILSPTRELCVQISESFENLGKEFGLKVVVIVGGLDPIKQMIALSKNPHISIYYNIIYIYIYLYILVVGTPGRIQYHFQNTKGFQMNNLKFLVLDEADKLLNMDFEAEINDILDKIPKERNTFLFSATMTNKVHKLQKVSLRNPVKIEVSTKYQTVQTLIQQYCFIPIKYKDSYLAFILNENQGSSCIIFVTTCINSIRLTLMLRNLGFQAVSIHGQMNQTKRQTAINKFKDGQKKILVATDVASRGLDIPCIDLVINYELPANTKEYIHRVGRTARAGRKGNAISLISQYDLEAFLKIEDLLGIKIDQYNIEEYKALVFNERINEAQKISTKQLKELIETKKIKE